MNNKRSLGILLVLLSFYSCERLSGVIEGENEVVAKVYDRRLYRTDLEKVIPKGLSEEDSAGLAKNYIEHWVKQESKLQLASRQLEEDAAIREKVESFRNSLILHEFKNNYIKSNLDSIVSEDVILEYYKTHEKDYTLRNDIIKGYFLKVPSGSPELDHIRTLMKSENDTVMEQELLSYSTRFGKSFIADDSVWVELESILRELPMENFDEEPLLNKNRFIEVNAPQYTYFLKINEHKTKGDTAPFDYIKPFIRNLIINQRKKDLINKLEDSLFQKGIENNDIRIF